MNRKRVTEARLKKAAKIWLFSVISQVDTTDVTIKNNQEYSDYIRQEAADIAEKELRKLGVTEFIGSEQDAINFVLRSST